MNHHTLAQICSEAYTHASFNLNECEAIIKYYDSVQVVAFRGTEAGSLVAGAGWVDVLRDLRILPWRDRDAGWVHAGFLKGGRIAADFLADRLVKDLPVICTGHSLGGALALMCAVKLQAQGYVIKQWVGFGSPKTQFSGKAYDFHQVNYRHRADVVPLMPRWTPYRHNYAVVDINPALNRKPTWNDHGIQHYVAEVV